MARRGAKVQRSKRQRTAMSREEPFGRGLGLGLIGIA